MAAIISIPEPCHEDWNLMTPREQGRHCDSCCKTVVDFTSWQPQEILFYMQQNAAKKVCGRFLPDQLNEPIPMPEDFVKQLHHFSVPFLKKAAAILIFAFSTMMVSCSDNKAEKLTGVVANPIHQVDSPPIRQLLGDTMIAPIELGEPAIVKDTAKKIKTKVCRQDIKGDIMVVPDQPLTGLIAVDPVPPYADTVKQPAIPVFKPDQEVIMGKMIATPQRPPVKTKH